MNDIPPIWIIYMIIILILKFLNSSMIALFPGS